MAKLEHEDMKKGTVATESHGGTAFSALRRGGSELDRMHAPLSKPFATLPHETEDSVITGGTRSLVRRLLALNIGGSLRKAERVMSVTSTDHLGSKIA